MQGSGAAGTGAHDATLACASARRDTRQSACLGDLTLQATGTGTQVVGLMNGDMGSNPRWCWMRRFMGGMLDKDFDTGLAKLKALAEKH